MTNITVTTDATDTKGLLIAIDGVDGSGKDTQLALLMQAFKNAYPGRESILVKCPYDQGISGVLRRLALGQPVAGVTDTWSLLANGEHTKGQTIFTGARTHADEIPDALVSHWLLFTEFLHTHRTVIQPALDRGAIVVCNRSHFTSNFAYGVALGLPPEELEPVIEMQERFMPYPEMIAVLDLPVEIAKARLASRSESGGEINHFDLVDEHVFQVRRASYHYLAESRWPAMVKLVDGNGTPEEVQVRLLMTLLPVLPAMKEHLLCV